MAINHYGGLSRRGLESLLLRPDREGIQMKETVLRDEPVRKITFQYPGAFVPVEVECCLAIEKGDQPVYLSESWTFKKAFFQSTVW